MASDTLSFGPWDSASSTLTRLPSPPIRARGAIDAAEPFSFQEFGVPGEPHLMSNNILCTYSEGPPSAPVQVFFVGNVPENIQTNISLQRLLQNMKEISEYLQPECLSSSFSLQSLAPVPPSSHGDASAIAPIPATPRKINDRTCQTSPRIARALVEELVTTMPLTETPTNTDGCFASTSSKLSESDEADLFRDSSSPLTIQTSARSIAIQTKSNKSIKIGKNMAEVDCAVSESSVALPEEWLGGVRALRDSHVRLVLRQLRHIKRLNRALDRGGPVHIPGEQTQPSRGKSRA